MGILLWIVFGLIAGSFARLVMPGPIAGGLPVALGLGVGVLCSADWLARLLAAR